MWPVVGGGPAANAGKSAKVSVSKTRRAKAVDKLAERRPQAALQRCRLLQLQQLQCRAVDRLAGALGAYSLSIHPLNRRPPTAAAVAAPCTASPTPSTRRPHVSHRAVQAIILPRARAFQCLCRDAATWPVTTAPSTKGLRLRVWRRSVIQGPAVREHPSAAPKRTGRASSLCADPRGAEEHWGSTSLGHAPRALDRRSRRLLPRSPDPRGATALVHGAIVQLSSSHT